MIHQVVLIFLDRHCLDPGFDPVGSPEEIEKQLSVVERMRAWEADCPGIESLFLPSLASRVTLGKSVDLLEPQYLHL